MTHDEAVQLITCIYDECLDAGYLEIGDRIIERQLMRCWPEIDWRALRETGANLLT